MTDLHLRVGPDTSLHCQPSGSSQHKTRQFSRKYILYFVNILIDANYKRQQQRPGGWCYLAVSRGVRDMKTPGPLDASPITPVLTGECYYTLFFGFHFSQTTFFAQTALNFCGFDVIILKLRRT